MSTEINSEEIHKAIIKPQPLPGMKVAWMPSDDKWFRTNFIEKIGTDGLTVISAEEKGQNNWLVTLARNSDPVYKLPESGKELMQLNWGYLKPLEEEVEQKEAA